MKKYYKESIKRNFKSIILIILIDSFRQIINEPLARRERLLNKNYNIEQ